MAHKYNARATIYDGFRFDSQSEALRYKQLKLMERAGTISDLQVHPCFVLLRPFIEHATGKKHRGIIYEADFSYIESGKPLPVVEDVKGVETEAFKLKKKLFLYQHPELELRIIK